MKIDFDDDTKQLTFTANQKKIGPIHITLTWEPLDRDNLLATVILVKMPKILKMLLPDRTEFSGPIKRDAVLKFADQAVEAANA